VGGIFLSETVYQAALEKANEQARVMWGGIEERQLGNQLRSMNHCSRRQAAPILDSGRGDDVFR
jgi:hypothetical protein